MIHVSNHGGSCCGARHLHSFDGIVNNRESLDTINRALQANVPVGRRVEVILNARQVTQPTSPTLLRRLADLGFVLTEHYMNYNHNPARDNFVFTRCDTRRPLTDLPFTWTGQIISAGLTGNLPSVAAPLPAPLPAGGWPVIEGAAVNPNLPIEFEGGTPATVVRVSDDGVNIYVRSTTGVRPHNVGGRFCGSGWDNGTCYYRARDGVFGGDNGTRLRIRNVAVVEADRPLAVGDTVQITNENAVHFNRSGTIRRLERDGRAWIEIPNVYRPRIFVPTSLRRIPAPVAPEPVPLPEMRHTQNDVAERVVERIVNVPAAPEPVRVIYQTFHNVFRGGRVGAGYPRLAEAERAAPRARTRLRRDVSSDGTVNDVTL